MVNRRSCLTGSKLAAPLNEEMRAPTVVDWIAIFPNKKMAKAVVRGPSQASDKPPKIDAKQDLFLFFSSVNLHSVNLQFWRFCQFFTDLSKRSSCYIAPNRPLVEFLRHPPPFPSSILIFPATFCCVGPGRRQGNLGPDIAAIVSVKPERSKFFLSAIYLQFLLSSCFAPFHFLQ